MGNNVKTFRYLATDFGDIPTYTFVMTAKDLVHLHYVAVRGVDKEDGAVQRTLNTRRINDIKKFILEGHTFFNSFILNWTDKNFIPEINTKELTLSIPIINRGAQVIDGQHRIAGFEAAIEEDNSIGNRNVIITLCLGLHTKQAAEIFLNINTEQKPVPKSLIYDLFGELVEDENKAAINRSTDLARELNENPESPLYNFIKFPGSPKRSQGIELSTVVSALREHVKMNGTLRNYRLETFDKQFKILLNYFLSIKYFYDTEGLWDNKNKNPFLKAVGLNGAIDFLMTKLIHLCAEKKSFTQNTMQKILAIDTSNLLTLESLRGIDGKTGRRKVKEYLESGSIYNINSDEYEI
ncbi:DGQHR domain-containing protein [Actinobacillus pleuropneumoniae]|nr:DGQHR domain-containing protein [Actinobacillus pleuropneumoniae]SUU53972.1 DGQHR domain [Actinobacillus pleuropneumoniae]